MTNLLDTLRTIAGEVHNRYIFGGSKAPGYDCSGSVWEALRRVDPYGMATVPRFYTWNLVSALASNNYKGVIKQVARSEHRKGDIVLWDGGSEGHVGICSDSGDNYFSFYNTKEGAKDYKISLTLRSITPKFYRITVAVVPPTPPVVVVPTTGTTTVVVTSPTTTNTANTPTGPRAPLTVSGADIDTVVITYKN